jgi:hypothetical protein
VFPASITATPHATAVEGNHWLTDHILVTLHDDGTLERIDTATGERLSEPAAQSESVPAGK